MEIRIEDSIYTLKNKSIYIDNYCISESEVISYKLLTKNIIVIEQKGVLSIMNSFINNKYIIEYDSYSVVYDKKIESNILEVVNKGTKVYYKSSGQIYKYIFEDTKEKINNMEVIKDLGNDKYIVRHIKGLSLYSAKLDLLLHDKEYDDIIVVNEDTLKCIIGDYFVITNMDGVKKSKDKYYNHPKSEFYNNRAFVKRGPALKYFIIDSNCNLISNLFVDDPLFGYRSKEKTIVKINKTDANFTLLDYKGRIIEGTYNLITSYTNYTTYLLLYTKRGYYTRIEFSYKSVESNKVVENTKVDNKNDTDLVKLTTSRLKSTQKYCLKKNDIRVTEFIFDKITLIGNIGAVVSLDKKCALLDCNGNIVLDYLFSSIEKIYHLDGPDNLFLLTKEGKHAFFTYDKGKFSLISQFNYTNYETLTKTVLSKTTNERVHIQSIINSNSKFDFSKYTKKETIENNMSSIDSLPIVDIILY